MSLLLILTIWAGCFCLATGLALGAACKDLKGLAARMPSSLTKEDLQFMKLSLWEKCKNSWFSERQSWRYYLGFVCMALFSPLLLVVCVLGVVRGRGVYFGPLNRIKEINGLGAQARNVWVDTSTQKVWVCGQKGWENPEAVYTRIRRAYMYRGSNLRLHTGSGRTYHELGKAYIAAIEAALPKTRRLRCSGLRSRARPSGHGCGIPVRHPGGCGERTPASPL